MRKTFGALWPRRDVCRRYVPPKFGGLQDVDYRTKTFSCSKCGAAACIAVIEPIKETGMQDYRLDEVERPERHSKAVDRLTQSTRSIAGRACWWRAAWPQGRRAAPNRRCSILCWDVRAVSRLLNSR